MPWARHVVADQRAGSSADHGSGDRAARAASRNRRADERSGPCAKSAADQRSALLLRRFAGGERQGASDRNRHKNALAHFVLPGAKSGGGSARSATLSIRSLDTYKMWRNKSPDLILPKAAVPSESSSIPKFGNPPPPGGF